MPAEAAVELDTERLFQELATAPPPVGRNRLFKALTDLDPEDLDALLLGRRALPKEVSARRIMHHLGELLELRQSDVAAILNVSPSRISRNDTITRPLLDRVYSLSETFALVSAVLGPEHARAWFKEPNPALAGEAPYKLMSTTYGAKKVENLITALLNGAFV